MKDFSILTIMAQMMGFYKDRDELINGPMTLFENLLVPDICPKWTNIIQQKCESGRDMMADMNSHDSKAMGYTCDALKVC